VGLTCRKATGRPVVAPDSRRWRTCISSVLTVTIVSLAVLVGTASPAAAAACSAVQVAAGSWLGGTGVDAHSNGSGQGTGNSCAGFSTADPRVQEGYGWQCVELAARLYAVKGWGRVYADGGVAAGVYRYGAQYIPEGSPNLTFHPNGSGYLPVPGDLIIEAWSSGWGHVSVVDRTVGNSVYAVEQNASLTGRHTYTLTGSTLTGQYGSGVRGFMHAPANTATRALGAPGALVTLSPARVLDTRTGNGAAVAPVAARADLVLQVAGRGGVPATGVSAVVVNVTVTEPTAAGWVSAFADGSALPLVSNLNFVKNQTVPNLAVVPVGADGAIRLHNGSGGTVQLVVDIFGYYLAGTPTKPGALATVSPARVLDTRTGNGAAVATVAARADLVLQVAGRGGVPATGVSAVVVNVTVTNQPRRDGCRPLLTAVPCRWCPT